MKLDEVISRIEKIANGEFFRIAMTTDLTSKMSAKYKKQGFKILKHTEMTTRTGVRYENLANYTEPKTERTTPSPWVHIIPNRIKYNENTKQHYIQLGMLPKEASNPEVAYTLITSDGAKTPITYEDLHEYMTASYFAPKDNYGTIITVNVNNITAINGEVI